MNANHQEQLILPGRRSALRVAVVDDDDSTREMLAEALALFGADVRSAGSVAEALELLADWHADLLVSDLGMPDANGYDLIRRLRALAPAQGGDLPALALTGYAREEQHHLALNCGYDEVLVKPVDLQDLLEAIRRVALADHPPE